MDRSERSMRYEFLASSPEEQGRREGISEQLVSMVDRCQENMQYQLDQLNKPGVPPPQDLVLLVFDGTSPLIVFAPPEHREGLRTAGNRVVTSKLVPRAELVEASKPYFPILSEMLGKPVPCQHLEYLATNGQGGVIRCVECDLGMKPKTPARRPS